MPQSLAEVLVHLVFSTKDRRPFLDRIEDRLAVHRKLRNISAKLDCPILEVGGIADHVHLLGRMSRTISLADWVKELKRVSSLAIKEYGPVYAEFAWQAGYGVFSVSHSAIEQVLEYIRRQEEHHHRLSFQDEFRILCRKHEIPIDERYVWD